MSKLITIAKRLFPKKFREGFKYMLSLINTKATIEMIMGGPEHMNWENPKNLNEKLQCLKLGEYYNNDVITRCTDKILVKDYIEEKKVNCKCAKIYGVYKKPRDINWEELPSRFLLKCNHGSGYNIIVDKNEPYDRKEIEKKLAKWLKEEYWRKSAETHYKFIEKRIYAEEYLGDDLLCYKFYCFHGVPKVFYVSYNASTGDLSADADVYMDFYDMDGQHLDICLKGHINKPVPLTNNLDKLVKVAKELASEFKFVRVDLYLVQDEVYLSELTFLPTGGYMTFNDPTVLDKWGEWLNL